MAATATSPRSGVLPRWRRKRPRSTCRRSTTCSTATGSCAAIERELAAAESLSEADHDGHRVGELHARLQEIDGYSARARAAALLAGLGFADADLERPVASFSGGWRMRLNLAQALMCRSDLLLLDEPTNHLDLDAMVWLEKWLAGYRGTLLLVSHDRDFLDGCVTHIAHISARRLTLYTGNYTAFEEQRAAPRQLAGSRRFNQKNSTRSRISKPSSRASAPRPPRRARRRAG